MVACSFKITKRLVKCNILIVRVAIRTLKYRIFCIFEINIVFFIMGTGSVSYFSMWKEWKEVAFSQPQKMDCQNKSFC